MDLKFTNGPASEPIAADDAAIRPAAASELAEDEALAQIQNLPLSKINKSELADRWGWSRGRVRRRLVAWKKAGQLGGNRAANLPAIRPASTPATKPASNPATGRPVSPATWAANRVVMRAFTPAECEAPLVIVTAGPAPATVAPEVPPATVAAPASVPAASRETGWHITGRVIIGLALILIAGTIVLTSLRGGVWAGYALSVDDNAGQIFSTLLVAAELLAAILPTVARLYWQMGEGWSAWQAWLIAIMGMAAVFLSISAFILVNVGDKTVMREQVMAQTPAVKTAQDALADAKTARDKECVKVGPICRERESTVTTRQTELNAAMAKAGTAASVRADPQAAALGMPPAQLRMIQAAVLVTICLLAGLVLSLGWGLVFRRR